jgi:hypothetical protein
VKFLKILVKLALVGAAVAGVLYARETRKALDQ